MHLGLEGKFIGLLLSIVRVEEQSSACHALHIGVLAANVDVNDL
jgi:hypothetical protein